MARDELERVKDRRASLYRATLALEEALAAPAGDLGQWCKAANEAASDMADRIAEHIESSERPGEFLSSIVEAAPHLVNATRKLIDEHGLMREAAAELIGLLSAPPSPSDAEGEAEVAESIREAGLRLMGLVVRHRQKGADLSYAAYQEDLGSSG
ncbi:MAG: hypothetical protein R2761_06610 [Acidimicrobiales bacterium]